MKKYISVALITVMIAACSSAQKAEDTANNKAAEIQQAEQIAENTAANTQAQVQEAVNNTEAVAENAADNANEAATTMISKGTSKIEATKSKISEAITVNFDTDSSTIKGKYFPVVKLFLSQIKQKGLTINIDGYTDNVGSEAYNDKLSVRRAEAVAKYLTDNGISRNIIITRGHGETNFVADNDTEAGRAKNRRAEISVTR